MNADSNMLFAKGELSDRHFNEFAEMITENLGIRMPDKKKQMLKCRLLRRIRALDLESFDEYYDYVFKKGHVDSEMQEFINAVTTNKTDFFREPQHFTYLTNVVVPNLLREHRHQGGRPLIKIWCAGCSSGEEPYTLSMVMSEYCRIHQHVDFRIIASDISTKVLNAARAGVYSESKVATIKDDLKRRYLLKSKDRSKQQVRFVPEIRSKIFFCQQNFMANSYSVIPDHLDVIFFRNVMIYFDIDTQTSVLNKMAPKLNKNGYLFCGHSESLKDLSIPFKSIHTAVYRKT